MSSLQHSFDVRRPRVMRRRSYIRHMVAKTGVAPGRLLVRLFMSALAGALAFHFWRAGDR